MRKINDILSEHRDTAKRWVLFEDGEWCIYRRENDRDYIVHRCAGAHKAQNPRDTTCHACSAVTPVALIGLFMLNEWER